jgi:hypothetical protein
MVKILQFYSSERMELSFISFKFSRLDSKDPENANNWSLDRSSSDILYGITGYSTVSRLGQIVVVYTKLETSHLLWTTYFSFSTMNLTKDLTGKIDAAYIPGNLHNRANGIKKFACDGNFDD